LALFGFLKSNLYKIFKVRQNLLDFLFADLIGASDAVLIGGAQPPEINASDLTATPYDPEEAFTDTGSFSS
jgi:hypothetical protein